ncbi:histidinol-phosphate transaminase [Fulvivirga maritima]|uniref:histidinol-phosphate transaminase n=1 Tax=Fulvivirga maritima TaxID=2904247 RepID=UPI001F3E88F2|nr:histidinol-phosphate transaminase [Fulvivirga maritima]UII26653.1 histidinol-phosphate transaminase [Fulvivirga maritima]
MNIQNLVRANIRALQPYSSARDEFTGNGEVFLDANENPFETEVNRYPDPYQRAIKENLAPIKAVRPAQIFLGNGSDEAIDLIIRIFCEPGKEKIIISDPSYGMYQVSAGINNIEVIKVPLSENFEFIAENMLKEADENTKVAFLCSPNNPSGNALDSAEVEKFIQSFEGIVVVDEAYIDFSSSKSFTEKLEIYPNLIVMQTFSKAWGMAGLRLGMAFASEEIIGLINKVKPPYNINILTQKAALEALSNEDKVKAEIELILQQKDWLQKEFTELPVTEHIFPSDSNFLLVKFKDAKGLFDYLIAKEIIVRDRRKVRFGDNCLRITVGTPEENKKLIAAIKNYQP